MTQPRRGLGRGLDALFSGISRQSAPEEPPAEPEEAAPEEAPQDEPDASATETPVAQHEPDTASDEEGQDDESDDLRGSVADDDAGGADDDEDVDELETEAYEDDDEPQANDADYFSQPEPPPSALAPAAPEPATPEPATPEPAAPEPATPEPIIPPEPAPAEAPPFVPLPEPAAEPPSRPAEPAAPSYETRRRGPDDVDVDLIAPNPEQPRTNFDPSRLHELADSIREHGIIQPLVVSFEDDGTYRLIAGERRLQAARLAGLRRVPVVIREVVDSELLELAIVENVQRADLNPVEEALAFRRLIDEYHLTQEETAQRVGKSRAAIANSLRLLQLETEVRRSLIGGEISEGHARALLGLPEGPTRLSALREVVRRGLSVRDTEALVRRNLAAKPETSDSPGAVTARRDVAISDVETRLRRALSTRVTVDPHKQGGARIVIECFSREEFDNVVSRLTDE